MRDWIASAFASVLTTTALIGAVLWLLKNWIATRLTEGIRRETEVKLVQAQLVADTKLAELKGRLDAAESQVADARRAGIEAMQQSNAALLAQRVTATQEVWTAVVLWRKASMLSMTMAAFTEEIAVANAGDVRGREAMTTMLSPLEGANLMELTVKAERWRPFVTERAWALWVAYNAFLGSRLTKAKLIKIGQKEMTQRLFKVNLEREAVRNATTPEIFAEFERNEINGSTKATSYWETELLAELRRGLAGEESGPEAARQAAKIIATVQDAAAKSAMVQSGAS